MNTFRYLFFDLDRTLWDFDENAREAFHDIFNRHSLYNQIPDLSLFFNRYVIYNENLWDRYRRGEISKERLRDERFIQTLGDFGIHDNELASLIGDEYISISPRKKCLVPHTRDILDYLVTRYDLFIITNGFREVQYCKLGNCELTDYFKQVFTSDEVGYQKPRREIFERAVTSLNARKEHCLMIGDDLHVDVLGARNAGIRQVYFNPGRIPHNEEVTYEISSLLELKEIL